MMKKLTNWTRTRCFDAAAAPLIIIFYGLPVLAVIAVVALVILGAVLIKRAIQKKKDAERDEQ